MSFFSKSNKAYISDDDDFLMNYDKEHPKKSASQQQEIDKYAEVDKKRDTPCKKKPSDIWSGF